MKKLKLLLIAFCFLTTIPLLGQTGMTFRMASPKLVNIAGSDYLTFDIEVMASNAGTFLYSGQAVISVNSSVVDIVTSSASRSTLTTGTYNDPLPPFDPFNKYNLSTTRLGGTLNVAWTAQGGLDSQAPSTLYFNSVTTSWLPVVTIYAKIINPNAGAAAISFVASSMTTQQFYHLAAATNPNYGPVTFDSDFTNIYVGRVYSNKFGWSQIGGSVNTTSSVNTSVWDGSAAITGGVLTNASALRIHSGAKLTVPVNGMVTVTGETDVQAANGLEILSDASGTGSLITGTAVGAGPYSVQRYIGGSAWQYVSSPVVQDIPSFLTANTNVATNGASRGMMDYNTTNNNWNPFFTSSTTGNLGGAKGFAMRVTGAGSPVTLTGPLQAGNQSVAVTTGWNCIGNPYSSAIGITIGSLATDKFLQTNGGSLNSSYAAIYIWNKSDLSNGQYGNYTAVSNVNGASYNDLQQGQAFLVNAASNTSLSFNPTMQLHSTNLQYKTTKNVWPFIKLTGSVNNQSNTTLIAFNSGMTKGLDPTYDAGMFKGSSDLAVYTKLVEDNGIPFAIQALPESYNDLIIPVGVDSKVGGDIIFSAETISLPSDCKVILEDKLNKTFTDLSLGTYKTTVSANYSAADRFFLHTSANGTGLPGDATMGDLNAYAVKNIELRVVGTVAEGAVASLYDVVGHLIMVKKLDAGSYNVIPLPTVKNGVYLLNVKDNGLVHSFKLPIQE